LVFAILSLFCVSVYGACTGSPPTYNGLPCATTTRYWDDQEGACGCGNSGGPFSWNGQQYTAAASQKIFDPSGSSWCGVGCGSCWEITPTGDCPTGGSCATNRNSIVIMVTNLCPNDGNEQWCPNPGAVNEYGYPQHFDLMDPNMAGWVDSLGWNNPVVTYKQVACGTLGSPTCAEASQCLCSTSACSQSGSPGSSTASAATSAKSSTSTTGSHPSSTTGSGTGSSGSGTCTASVSTSIASSWSGGGQVDITVKNTGSQSISEVVLSISASPAVFNLVLISGSNYNLASYAYPLAASATFTGAGFTYSGSEPSVSISSVSC